MANKTDGMSSPGDTDGQKPQCCEDRQAPGYDNDVAPNWLRGMGKGEAEGKPGFDKKRSG